VGENVRRLVQALLATHGGKIESLAAEVGVAPSTVWRWSIGRTDPRPNHRALLEDAARRDCAAVVADDMSEGGSDENDG
jgi:hypothetical protein